MLSTVALYKVLYIHTLGAKPRCGDKELTQEVCHLVAQPEVREAR